MRKGRSERKKVGHMNWNWISRSVINVTSRLKYDATIRTGLVGVGKDCSVGLQERQKPERSKQSEGEETASRKSCTSKYSIYTGKTHVLSCDMLLSLLRTSLRRI